MTHNLQPLNVVKPVTLFYVIAGSQPAGERCGGVGEGEKYDEGAAQRHSFWVLLSTKEFLSWQLNFAQRKLGYEASYLIYQ